MIRRILPRDIVRAAAILGLLSILGGLALFISRPNIFYSQVPKNLKRLPRMLDAIERALAAYRADHGAYPLPAPMYHREIPPGSAGPETTPSGEPITALPPSLTTPISYIGGDQIWDPFHPNMHGPFAYASDGRRYLLFSAGPDVDYLLSPKRFRIEPSVDETYDPTNGTISRGEIWRVRSN